MEVGLLSSSMIVAVAVSAAPIILPGVAVNMAVNVSMLSSVSSFTMATLIFCLVSLGAKVTIVLF